MDFLPAFFDGTLRAHYLLLFGAAGGIALVAGTVSAWVGARIGARCAVRRAMQETAAANAALAATAERRLAEVARGVDAIAIEVERIAEAQRYTARLLTERTLPRVPGVPGAPGTRTPEHVTPH